MRQQLLQQYETADGDMGLKTFGCAGIRTKKRPHDLFNRVDVSYIYRR